MAKLGFGHTFVSQFVNPSMFFGFEKINFTLSLSSGSSYLICNYFIFEEAHYTVQTKVPIKNNNLLHK